MDSKIGRFLQVDPHAGNYDNLSQYQYCLNNPLIAIDPDGKDVVYLVDNEGAMRFGHAAVMIGNDDDGWNLFSFNTSGNKVWRRFDTYSDFENSEDEEVTRYFDTPKDKQDRLKTSPNTDEKLTQKAVVCFVLREYNLRNYNCADFVVEVLNSNKNIKRILDKITPSNYFVYIPKVGYIKITHPRKVHEKIEHLIKEVDDIETFLESYNKEKEKSRESEKKDKNGLFRADQ